MAVYLYPSNWIGVNREVVHLSVSYFLEHNTSKMADSSGYDSRASLPQNAKTKPRGSSNDLDARQTPTMPAWKLREQMKAQGPQRPPAAPFRRPIPKPKKDLDGDVDPNLPPAFRAAFRAQRKKGIDDFDSLASVHTTTSTTRMSENDSDSDSSSDFDGHGSFASLGDDDNDDEAYREGRNQMARQSIESSRKSPPKMIRGLRKQGGVSGTPLDFIAE